MLLAFFSGQLLLAEDLPDVVPGCEYEAINLDVYGFSDFQNPEVIYSKDGYLETTLDVRFGRHNIGGCPTKLRNYNGRLVGPTLRVKPGDTLLVRLTNSLPPETEPPPEDHNIPHGFNITNLHTHGLHVSPAGNSDNVMLTIKPGQKFDYEIKVPRDHPPGTFWYHAHVHGSTAIQVSSGMHGAIIIEGGLDKVPQIHAAKEKIWMLQQISYDQQGRVENFKESFSPTSWEDHKRQPTVNGQMVPIIRMQPGEVQRWRLVHAGIRESIYFQVKEHEVHELAVDGLALGKVDTWDIIELQPGYRSDILVKAAQKEGEYWIVDAQIHAAQSMFNRPETEKILGKLIVSGTPKPMPLPKSEALANLRPHQDIRDDEITGNQEVRFSIEVKDGKALFMVNERPFSADHVRKLKLGKVEEWLVSVPKTSVAPNHPFHIHVNPFQHTRTGPDGNPEIVWRDTLMIRQGFPERLRTRYERYVGMFVLHCHILDHEDQGMMELVEVVDNLEGGHGGHGGKHKH